MGLVKKLTSRRGFTLAEVMIVIAILAILAGIAFIFVDPDDLSYVEYNRSAEAIATAAQNSLTEIRNSGDMAVLRQIGKSATEGVTGTETPAGATAGGYRYIFNYTVSADKLSHTTQINYILPFGAIEYDLAHNYFAIGFQSDTGEVGEVFYSPQPFAGGSADGCTLDYLTQLRGDAAKRKAEKVGYYAGTTDDKVFAFANLPTPQLTITNFEELSLSIYLPHVKQLDEYGKEIGLLISLADEDRKVYTEKNLSYTDTAIYSTFGLGKTAEDSAQPAPVVKQQVIASGQTYKMVLDTVQPCIAADATKSLKETPTGVFEDWAKRSAAYPYYKNDIYLLGDNVSLTVTVYCLGDDGTIDPTYMPRSASVIFNGWFNHYSGGTVDIACGRHLQNLGKLAELRSKLAKYLPSATRNEAGIYEYGDYNYGMANTYTDGSSNASPSVEYDDIAEKYDRRDDVKKIKTAYQVNAIDFACDEWTYDGKPIPFTPLCLENGVTYYGNYLTINHLYVDAPFYAGLFGYAYHAKLYDILLVNPSVTSQMPAHLAEMYEMGVGALIGTSRHSSEIANCQVYMTAEGAETGEYHPEKYRVTGECYVGGLIGFCEDEDIGHCSASVYTGYAAGATKMMATEGGTTAEVNISSKYVGGLIGCITGDSNISECYAAGNLSGEYVGGLVGFIKEDSDPSGDDYRISTCYTAGHIEYASREAAGILGYISELAGNAKSALSIGKNYCVVIYGTKVDGAYQWNCKTQSGETVPIYATFKGDGFEWLRTDQLGFYDTYLTGSYGGLTFFAGAVFEEDNKNYYIAQKGITYSNSPYYEAMYQAVQKLLQGMKGVTDKDELINKISAAKEEIVLYKKMQTLEELKLIMEELIYQVESETGTYTVMEEVKNGDGSTTQKEVTYKYNEGGYIDSAKIWYDKDRAKVEGEVQVDVHSDKTTTTHDGLYLTLVQALHVIYDGTYTDAAEKKQTVTGVSYKGSTTLKKKLNTYEIYNFMDYYNFLKEQFTLRISGTAAEKASAQQKLEDILGDNKTETYETPQLDSKGNQKYDEATGKPLMDTHQYYESGLLYQHFYSDLLNRLFDKAKDYFEEDLKDKTGELIYRYFRGITEKFRNVFADLEMDVSERDRFLLKSKQDAIQAAIDELKNYKNITALWTDGKDDEGNPLHPMCQYASTINGYVDSAVTALQSLLTALQGTFTTAQLQEKMAAAEAELKPLYDFFNDDAEIIKNTVDIVGIKTNNKGETEYVTGDMRNLRDPVLIHRRSVALCAATANSSVENAIDDLKIKVNELAEGGNVTPLVEAFEAEINTYLGTQWDYTDSGHRIKNSEEMRNAARGYLHGNASETRDSSLGFMYDYQNEHSENPYNFTKDAYVDGDNGIYNNVFPYTENAYTHYYPFPFVYGREEKHSVGGSKEQHTYVLFHYGDWLTYDLWADTTISSTTSALNEVAALLSDITSELETAKELAQNEKTGNLENSITALSTAIEGCEKTVAATLAMAESKERTDALHGIATTIHGWLTDNKGAFAELEKACSTGNKDFIVTLRGKLTEYRERLEALIKKINEL